MRPTALMLLAALPALAGCATPLTPIARVETTDMLFKARIAERFGPGTPALGLRTELAAEGFGLSAAPGPYRFRALWRDDTALCNAAVRVEWDENRRGRITRIRAARTGACPQGYI